MKLPKINYAAILALSLVASALPAVVGYACTGESGNGCYCVNGDCIQTINGSCAVGSGVCGTDSGGTCKCNP